MPRVRSPVAPGSTPTQFGSGLQRGKAPQHGQAAAKTDHVIEPSSHNPPLCCYNPAQSVIQGRIWSGDNDSAVAPKGLSLATTIDAQRNAAPKLARRSEFLQQRTQAKRSNVSFHASSCGSSPAMS